MLQRMVGIVVALLATCATADAQALQLYNWLGNGADDNWSNAANWAFGPPPSGAQNTVVSFGGLTNASLTNSSSALDALASTSGTPPAFELARLSFGGFNVPYTLNQGVGGPLLRFVRAIDINGNPTNTDALTVDNNRSAATTINIPMTTTTTGNTTWTLNGTGPLTINSNTTISNANFLLQQFSGATGTITINGNFAAGSASVTLSNISPVVFNGVISGSANGVRFNGTGTTTLTAANTYTAFTSISNTGTVRLAGGDNRLPVGTVQFNAGGRIDLNGTNQQFNTLTYFNSTAKIVNTSATASTLTIGGSSSVTIQGPIGETGGNNLGLTYAASGGSLTLTAANTYTGPTIVNTSRNLSLSGTGSIANSSSIRVNAPGTLFVNALTGGASYDTATSRFLLNPNQTLFGTGTVYGHVNAGPGGILQAGTGTATETLTVRGSLRVQGGGSTAGSAIWRVHAQDQPNNVRSNVLAVTLIDGGGGTPPPADLNLFISSQQLVFDLRDTGSLVQGTPYSMTIAQAGQISRNGVLLTSAAGGGTHTFLSSDYTITSPTLTLQNISLVAEGGLLKLNFTPVPEPGLLLAAGALAGILARRRRASLVEQRRCI